MATETFIIDIRTRGTKRSASDVRRIGQSATQVRKTLAFLRNALVAVAAVRVFASLTSDLVNFSDQMLVVKAVTAATAQEFVKLREVAKGLGATTRFTASEAAEGMAFLARAGFDVNEVISGIPATLNLAAAAALDLGNAADIASNLMTSFGRTTAELPDIIDTLVFTANNANTTVQQLADGLKLFAPIASQLGISLKDASAAMAVLGDAGIQASLAGTGVRRVLTDLEAPTGTLAKALDALGIEFAEVRPSAVGLEGALKRLKDANVGASISSLLFGKRGGFVAAQLLRALGPMGDFRKELERIEGTAKKAADEMESGLGGALRLVRSAFQNLLISFADLGGEEFLNDFFRGLAESLRTLALNADKVVKGFKILIIAFATAKVLSFGAAILTATARMAALTATTVAAIFTTTTYTGAVKALSLALLRLPFVAILTTLTLLIAGFATFQDEIKLTNDGTVTLADTFTALENTVGKTLLAAINSAGFGFEDFGDIVDRIATQAGLGFTRLVANLNGVVQVIKTVFNEFPRFFGNLGSEIQRLFFQTLEDSLNGLISGINSLFKVLRSDRKFELFDLGTLIPQATSLGVDLKEAFNKGFNEVGVELFKAADTRRAAERGEARRRLEEAVRAAVKARADAAAVTKTEVDGGITIEELGLGGAGKAAKEVEKLTEALRDLEAQFFPLLAAQDDEAEVMKIINDARAKGITLRVSEAELLKRVARERIGANQTIGQAQEEQAALRRELDKTNISLEEFAFLSRKSSIAFLEGQRDAASGAQRAFLKFQQDSTDAAKSAEMLLTNAFKGAEDALVEFVNTGKLSFSDLINSIERDLLRLAAKGVFSELFGGFAGERPESSFLGSVFGGGAGGGGGGEAVGALGGFFKNLFGAKNGADFLVGSDTSIANVPGEDNRVVAFKAKDGERVTVEPVGGNKERPIVLNFNISTPDANSFRRSQGQILNDAQQALRRAGRRNG